MGAQTEGEIAEKALLGAEWLFYFQPDAIGASLPSRWHFREIFHEMPVVRYTTPTAVWVAQNGAFDLAHCVACFEESIPVAKGNRSQHPTTGSSHAP